MDIYERIRQDHDTLRRLLDRLDTLPAQEGRSVYDELQRELWSHGKIEEVVFYAALAGCPKARAEAVEGLNEHHLINSLADELNAMSPDGMAWTAKLQVLGEMVRHHLKEEEEELFGKAREALDDTRARELGRLFDERKNQVLAAIAPLPGPP